MPREDESGVHHGHDGRLTHIRCSHRDLHEAYFCKLELLSVLLLLVEL